MKITEDVINHNIIKLISEQDISSWVYGDITETTKEDAMKELLFIEGMITLGNELKKVLKV